jgi:pimeloyl-ACP methyl ester carboxylesterase
MKWQDLNQQFLVATETIEHIQPDNCAYPLELLRHVSAHDENNTPVLFLHGIFVGAWCWQHFLPDFAEHGWDAWALSFRGHGNSQANGWFGLNDFVSDAEIAVDYIYRQTGKMNRPDYFGDSLS